MWLEVFVAALQFLVRRLGGELGACLSDLPAKVDLGAFEGFVGLFHVVWMLGVEPPRSGRIRWFSMKFRREY
ncbi:MAG: hypothetical protein ACXVH1_34465, partial [Solirubrobacteraceae bacterium]